MKLREKTLIIIISAFFALFIILFVTNVLIVVRSFIELENQDTAKNVSRIADTINDNISKLDLKNKDYASWDQTYDFMENWNEDYLKSEFADETFSNLNINLLAIADKNLNFVFIKGFDFETLKETSLDIYEKEFLQEVKKSFLLTDLKEQESVKGISRINKKYIMLSIRPILTTENKGPSRGYMLMGRYLDSMEIQNINKVVHSDFNIYDVECIEDSPQDIKKYYNLLLQNKGILVKMLNFDTVAGYITWKDIYGKDLFFIRVPIERKIFHQGLISIKYLIVSLLIVAAAASYLIIIILDKLVLKRLLRLNSQVDAIGKTQDFSLRVEVKGNDELSNLAASVNDMLKNLESSVNILKYNNEKLKELDKLKNEFISTVSHELRTPLTSILGFAAIIKKRLRKIVFPKLNFEDDKVKKAYEQSMHNLDIVLSEGERLTNIVNDVLDIAKMEAGKMDFKKESVNIKDIINRAVEATEALLNDKKLSIKVEVEEKLPAVTGDKDKLLQVIINLISNAVKFTEEGLITLRAYLQEDEIIVSIVDTGIGIAEENYSIIFEKFKQVGDSLVNKTKGTGLGLPICKSIVEHHGGRIWVESSINKGSSFSFSLPASEEKS
ncbi:ATP-binding protein [Clostridium sp. SYSU_GA19001]|uniref:CHASE4 domain-containing protein n=1 Tax=Clostridium caldaquaticum TaxID=2940653 RepID=UPI002077558D|nr:CHASE4 domain-containing protein [Clostridium caldaquaticum]MCM8709477.1 ATP-binding protein [Clostridium caldaquaticum]